MARKKLLLIVLVVLAAASFGVSFLLSRMFAGGAGPQDADSLQGEVKAGLGALPAAMILGNIEKMKPGEKELESLIKELRYKLAEFQRKEEKLDEREKRIEIANQMLKQDAQGLERIRVELAVPLRRLKEQLAELRLERIRVLKREAQNLKMTATLYGGMKDAAAAKILEGMQEEEAAKILYYMTKDNERAASKILTKMDPKIARKLTGVWKKFEEQGT